MSFADRKDSSIERIHRSMRFIDRKDSSIERTHRSKGFIDRKDSSIEGIHRSKGLIDRKDSSIERTHRSMRFIDRKHSSIERTHRSKGLIEAGRHAPARVRVRPRKGGFDSVDAAHALRPRRGRRPVELCSSTHPSQRFRTTRVRPIDAQRCITRGESRGQQRPRTTARLRESARVRPIAHLHGRER